MKKTIKILIITFLFPALTISADTIIKNDGQKIQCVVLTENNGTIECEVPIGRITFHRSDIKEIHKDTEEHNAKLREAWREKKTSFKKEIYETDQEYSRVKTKKHFLRFGRQWVTQEEFKRLQEKRDMESSFILKQKLKSERELIETKRDIKEKKKIRETIEEGRKIRSDLANNLLDSSEWQMIKGPVFTIFYQSAEDKDRAERIRKLAQYYFNDLKQKLSFDVSFIFRKTCEIYLVENPQMLFEVRKAFPNAPYPACVADYYKKEFFIETFEYDENVRDAFLFEYAGLFLYEFENEYLENGKKIPLWFRQGFSRLTVGIDDKIPADIIRAVKNDYHIRLNELMAMNELPDVASAKREMYDYEAYSLVEYVFRQYNPQKAHDLLLQYIDISTKLQNADSRISPSNVKKAMRELVQNSFLKDTYAGYGSFDDAWRLYIINKDK